MLAMRTLALALGVCGASLAAAGQTAPTAADVAKQVQAHYNGVRDFVADFTQSYKSPIGRQTTQDRGRVRIKKPGRMWWDYKAQKVQVVADGSQIYTYLPDDRKLYVAPLPKTDEASSAMMFLAGRGDLLRDFTPSLGADQAAGSWRLDLAPKTAQADFKTLALIVNRTTMTLEGLVTTDDAQGVTTYAFTNLKENTGLADGEFVFNINKIPKDVEVIKK
jgi:outer membrane lipoprotein carrier protein